MKFVCFFSPVILAGGYLADSLAILSDAAHMLSDFASFLISLFAIWVATRKPSKGMSFGWHRAGLYDSYYVISYMSLVYCKISHNKVAMC